MKESWTENAYDERYRAHESLWSGNPNPQLVSEVAALSPGFALDAGCGEGADAIWLAGQGWRVTAVDFSAVALERAGARARELGPDIESRISWLQRDLTAWQPQEKTYDLVSAQFLHLPPEQRGPIFGSLGSAVLPGGTLLIVGHHASDPGRGIPRPANAAVYFSADAVAARWLEPGAWDIDLHGPRDRRVTITDGQTVEVHDEILRARRRA